MIKFKKFVAVVSVLFGFLFVAIGGSDVQLGFGVVLISNGIFHL